MRYIVDRIEGEYAVCEAEDMSMVDIPLTQLPDDVKEGSAIEYLDGTFVILPSDQNRKMRVDDLMNDLWK